MKPAEGPPPRPLRPGAGGYSPDDKATEFIAEIVASELVGEEQAEDFLGGPLTKGYLPKPAQKSGEMVVRVRYQGPSDPRQAIAWYLDQAPKRSYSWEEIDA